MTNEAFCDRITKENSDAGVAELADAPDLGSGGYPCRFKSCRPHQKGAVSNANFRAFEAALFLCIEAKIQKIKKKASK